MDKFNPPPPKKVRPDSKNKKQDKRLKIALFIIIITFCFFIFFIVDLFKKTNFEENSNYKMKKELDSLKSELFIEQIKLEKYEIAIDIIKVEDTLLYKEIEKYLNKVE